MKRKNNVRPKIMYRQSHFVFELALTIIMAILAIPFECQAAPWEPPIGIPKPEFGIEETYRMYDDPANRNPDLTYHQNAEGSYYTHYIDNTHPEATDTDNPYGTASKPRRSIPQNLPPGSVVEVHSELPHTGLSAEVLISGEEKKERPIFISGVGNPRTERALSVGFYGNASYIIVEGMSFFA